MIRSDRDLKLARQQVAEQHEQARHYRASLEAEGLSADAVERLVDLRLHFSRELADEITWYEQARAGYLGPTTLAGLGRLLVGLRIAHELSPSQLAEEQGISKGVVSRDEQNEYRNLTIERALRILDALNEEDLYVMRASMFRTLEGHLSAGMRSASPYERPTASALTYHAPTQGETLIYGHSEAKTPAAETAARSIVGISRPEVSWGGQNTAAQVMAPFSYANPQELPLYNKKTSDQALQKPALAAIPAAA